MKDLIKQLQDADGPDRELDAQIRVNVIGLCKYESIYERGGDLCLRYYPGPPTPSYHILPRYTSSIDAALKLIPSAHDWFISFDPENERFHAQISDCVWDESFDNLDGFSKASPAIAICIAALRAKGEGE